MKYQKKIKESMSLTIEMKRIKYIGINLPKVKKKNLCEESYKTLMKEIKDKINKWK